MKKPKLAGVVVARLALYTAEDSPDGSGKPGEALRADVCRLEVYSGIPEAGFVQPLMLLMFLTRTHVTYTAFINILFKPNTI